MPLLQLSCRLRQTIRITGVGVHLGIGLGLVLAVFPWLSDNGRQMVRQRWARSLLRCLGVGLAFRGGAIHGGLLVANHISWLDIFVINAATQTSFVCKLEVRDWPLIGRLCAGSGTIFIDRHRRSAARRVNQVLVDKFCRGEQVAVFPEGTTGDGTGLTTFRAALLQAAIDADCLLQPLALRYLDQHGEIATDIAYAGATTLWQSLCAIAGARGVTANLTVLAAIPAATLPRRELAERARCAIHAALHRHDPLVAIGTENGVAVPAGTLTEANA